MACMTTYFNLMHSLDFYFRQGYSVDSIGKSLDGRDIPYIYVGKKGAPCIFITAGIHAREHISCYVVMQQLQYILSCSKYASSTGDIGIYFLPMLNPDGNMLIAKGLGAMRNVDKTLLKKIIKKTPRALFKANARGVDLNVNFDANWGTGKQNVFEPSFANFVGAKPFSEPESRALADFTYFKKPLATVSYHSLGREIYWEFGQTGQFKKRDKKIAEFLNQRLKYNILDDDGTSAGGYKDWCIQKLAIPSFTIELGLDEFKHPFTDYSRARDDVERNVDLPLKLAFAIHNSQFTMHNY